MPPSWSTWMLTLEALSPALLLFKFSLVCTDLEGVKGDWAQYYFWQRQRHWLFPSGSVFSSFCRVERTWICSDIWTYCTSYKAAPQHPVHCRNTLSRSPILCSKMAVCFLLDFYFFCFSINICQKIVMNESGFVRRVTVHSQLFNDFDYLLELGENLTACHRQC